MVSISGISREQPLTTSASTPASLKKDSGAVGAKKHVWSSHFSYRHVHVVFTSIRFSAVHRSGYGGELRLPFLPTRIFRAGYPKRTPPDQRGEQDVFSGIFGLILKADHDP